MAIKEGDREKLIFINSTSDIFKLYFSSIPDNKASSNPPTEKPIFLPFKSAIDFIGPSFKTTRELRGTLTNVPTLTTGKPWST